MAVVVVNGTGPDKPEEERGRTSRAASRARSANAVAARSRPGRGGAPVGATVQMRGLRFTPPRSSVDVGEAVRFVNGDNVAHTVCEDFGARSGEIAAVDSDRILPGRDLHVRPAHRGADPLVCTLHPTVMTGQILVEQPAT